jgi:hypothetical protein
MKRGKEVRDPRGDPIKRDSPNEIPLLMFVMIPFPLSLSECRPDAIEPLVLRTLTDFRGIRRTLTVAKQARKNLEWLERGGWSEVEQLFNRLGRQRDRQPQPADRTAEREAAHSIDHHLAGFGPKQSRNLWLWLGLTRYEIPLDSRVAKWVNENLSFSIEVGELDDSSYYESSLDQLQTACAAAGILPCIFDAAAFNDENKKARDQDRDLEDHPRGQRDNIARLP